MQKFVLYMQEPQCIATEALDLLHLRHFPQVSSSCWNNKRYSNKQHSNFFVIEWSIKNEMFSIMSVEKKIPLFDFQSCHASIFE